MAALLAAAVLTAACSGSGGEAIGQGPVAGGSGDTGTGGGGGAGTTEDGASADPLAGLTDFDEPPPHADEPSPLEPSEPFGLAALELVAPDGTAVRVPVYVAADGATRQRGLMHREELAADAGMVFLFTEERSGGFWMKNTLIPLSILYYGPDGDVRAVLDMEPCEADPCPVYDPGVTYVGALEVNQGWFDDIGLDTSWRVELPNGLPDPE